MTPPHSILPSIYPGLPLFPPTLLFFQPFLFHKSGLNERRDKGGNGGERELGGAASTLSMFSCSFVLVL